MRLESFPRAAKVTNCTARLVKASRVNSSHTETGIAKL